MGNDWKVLFASVGALARCGQKGVPKVIMGEWMAWIVGYVVSLFLYARWLRCKLPTYRTRAYSKLASHTPPHARTHAKPTQQGTRVLRGSLFFSFFIFIYLSYLRLQVITLFMFVTMMWGVLSVPHDIVMDQNNVIFFVPFANLWWSIGIYSCQAHTIRCTGATWLIILLILHFF